MTSLAIADRTPALLLSLACEIEELRRHGDMSQGNRDGLVMLGHELLEELIDMEDAGIDGASEALNRWP